MNIGIIGSGSIGSTVAQLLVDAGHDVTIANSRGPETLAGLVGDLGPNAHAGTIEDATSNAEVVVLAIPLVAYTKLDPVLFAGKIVVDANNYYPERDGNIPELDDDSTTSSELIAAHLPDSKVVKAFNTMYFQELGSRGDASRPRDERIAILVAGDDADAKATVSSLIDDIGYSGVDSGSLADGGRKQQQGAELYGAMATAAAAEAALA